MEAPGPPATPPRIDRLSNDRPRDERVRSGGVGTDRE